MASAALSMSAKVEGSGKRSLSVGLRKSCASSSATPRAARRRPTRSGAWRRRACSAASFSSVGRWRHALPESECETPRKGVFRLRDTRQVWRPCWFKRQSVAKQFGSRPLAPAGGRPCLTAFRPRAHCCGSARQGRATWPTNRAADRRRWSRAHPRHRRRPGRVLREGRLRPHHHRAHRSRAARSRRPASRKRMA